MFLGGWGKLNVICGGIKVTLHCGMELPEVYIWSRLGQNQGSFPHSLQEVENTSKWQQGFPQRLVFREFASVFLKANTAIDVKPGLVLLYAPYLNKREWDFTFRQLTHSKVCLRHQPSLFFLSEWHSDPGSERPPCHSPGALTQVNLARSANENLTDSAA